jgi:hypothetical protein
MKIGYITCTEILEESEKFSRKIGCSVKQEQEILPIPRKADDEEEEEEKEFPKHYFKRSRRKCPKVFS